MWELLERHPALSGEQVVVGCVHRSGFCVFTELICLCLSWDTGNIVTWTLLVFLAVLATSEQSENSVNYQMLASKHAKLRQ